MSKKSVDFLRLQARIAEEDYCPDEAVELRSAADELDRLERMVGCCKGQVAEAVAILESGTAYEKVHVVAILNDALKSMMEAEHE